MLRFRHVWLVAACLAYPLGSAALADDAGAKTDLELEVLRLRAQLDAQQQQIAELKLSGAQQDADRARVEQMKAQIREILSEREFRESLMPSTLQAGYDNGFFIRSSDDKFKMQFNGLLQFRWTYYNNQTTNAYQLPGFKRDDLTGFDLQRVRFTVSGHAVTPDLTYLFDFRSDAPEEDNVVFDSVWVNYRFADEFQVRFGQFTLASTRSQMTSDAGRQFVDKSFVDAVFGLGASIGVRLWGQLLDKRMDYYVDVVNATSDDGNTNASNPISSDPAELDNNPAILARVLFRILGDEPGKDFEYEGDPDIRSTPAWEVGFHYAFNEDKYDSQSTRIPVPRIRPFGVDGGFGLVSTNGLQFHQFGIDSAFKWMGFSLTGEYIGRIVDPRRTTLDRLPLTPWYIASGDDSTTLQQGGYLQAGYFLPIPGLEKKFEIVARAGGIAALAERTEGVWEYAAGVNYYIDGNRVKLQADVTKIYEAPTTSSYASLANVNDDALIFRTQLQLAF